MRYAGSGNPDTTGADGQDRAVGKIYGTPRDHLGHQRNTLSRGKVGQTDDAGMGFIALEDEEFEIGIDGDQHTPLGYRPAQQCLVTGVRRHLGGLAHVVTRSPRPFGKPVPCARSTRNLIRMPRCGRSGRGR
jgi:hypothetical protein